METWNALTSRRNVRQYRPDPIERVVLDRILEAGRRAPSANNRQWWDLVVSTERDQLTALSGVWQGAGHIAGAAAAISVIVATVDDPQAQNTVNYDLGQLTMSMMVIAADAGVGSAHASVRDQDLARQILGFPEDSTCAWLIGFGYPADRELTPIVKPNRRPIEEMVHWDRW